MVLCGPHVYRNGEMDHYAFYSRTTTYDLRTYVALLSIVYQVGLLPGTVLIRQVHCPRHFTIQIQVGPAARFVHRRVRAHHDFI